MLPVGSAAERHESMSEFVFKNLSVKVISGDEEGLELCADPKTFVMCDASHTCPGEAGIPTNPPPDCGWCTNCTHQTCGDRFTNQVTIKASPEEILAEVRLHKDALLAVVENLHERERRLMGASMPKTLEQADRLRTEIVTALEELDEYRAKLTAEGPAAEEQ
jgi:hypothetical protein